MEGRCLSALKRLIAAAVAAAFLFGILIAGLFIIIEADHECEGEHCHVCECLEQCQAALHQIGFAPASGRSCTIPFLILLILALPCTDRRFKETPVSEKVQLNI